MGERFDFQKMKLTSTGGIYVRAFPLADQITVDSKIKEKPSILSNSIFVQSLVPNFHTVLVQKTGYYDYSKIIPVKEKEVTKIENITLFKKNIQFEVTKNTAQSPFSSQKTTPVIKNSVAFNATNSSIIWLSTAGLLWQSDSTGKNPIKLTTTPIKISKVGTYKILISEQKTFVVANGNLLLLNTKTSNLDLFSSFAKDAKLSPDGKNIVYFDDNHIYISLASKSSGENNPVYTSSDLFGNLQWINNDYVVFTAGDKIIISEIDYRGNINKIILPQKITLVPDKEIAITNPKILFNQQTGKLYIQTGNTILVSEKILP